MRIHHATVKKAAKFHITLTLEENDIVATDRAGRRLASGPQGNKVLEEAITKVTGHPAKKVPVKRVHANFAPNQTPNMPFPDEDEEPSDEDLEVDAAVADEDESDADQSRSVVKARYKALYKPHKDKCGDEVSVRVNAHITRVDEETGERRVSLKALRSFASANGCWVPSYANLISRTGGWNAGMAAMNVTNRLRAKIRQAKKAGEKFEIQWV